MVEIFVHLKVGNYLLSFLLTIRSTDTFETRNNAMLALLRKLYYQGIRRMEEVTSDEIQRHGGNSHYILIVPQ